MRIEKFPEFIPLDSEIFRRFCLPFSVNTVYRHRSQGGPLRRFTVKDPATGKVLFLLRAWAESLEREGGHGGRRS